MLPTSIHQAKMNTMPNLQELVDQSLLKPDTTTRDIEAAVKEAQQFNYNSLCIRPEFTAKFAPQYRVSTVIGFPQDFISCDTSNIEDLKYCREIIGKPAMATKVVEARKALSDGALELDPVIDIKDLAVPSLSFPGDKMRKELQTYMFLLREFANINYDNVILSAAKNPPTYNLKPIFSCEILSEEEIRLSVQIFAEEVIGFLEQFPEMQERIKFSYKNSTGFIKSRDGSAIELASPRLISLIATELDKHDLDHIIGIKAAGGVRDLSSAEAVSKAATGRLSHIGTSAGAGLAAGTTATAKQAY